MNIRARLAKLERKLDIDDDDFSRLSFDELLEEIRKLGREISEEVSEKLGIPIDDVTLQHKIDHCDLPGELAELADHWRAAILHGAVKCVTELHAPADADRAIQI